ncbi:scytonemin biosynthesis protein ScyA [Iningainema tapete]|uniref:Scytonemin biosynthesis protein ScyA n=1 Tax=Iningainema tapete BLCC-T55 TaxID=2748662 RepID=A0A8J7C8S3_9CYAN|nr:scytonemin biosynthesis protein ScyA [Iningainema tapete]MBD2775051.1 scytonemin biosynthesis protein ScyA [Iningainema tapete BLCC-T55]
MIQNYTQTTSQIGARPYQVYEPNGHVKSEPANGAHPSNATPVLDEVDHRLTVADAVVQMLENLGVCCAFGVNGGAMATFWGSLSNSLVQVVNCRHEAGAAFAATEAYFANGRPTVVFTTAGPGITNALTGLYAARDEGAKVIFISACTSASQRGRWAIQETSSQTLPTEGIFTPGPVFNYAAKIESGTQLPQIFRKLALGLSSPGGFVAHLSIPTAVQSSLVSEIPTLQSVCSPLLTPDAEVIERVVQLLSEGPFAIWLGFGARGAAEEIRQLAEKTGAAVMCSPRGKGIFPENHPQFVGVTGLGGHSSVFTYMHKQPPIRTLVLGTRLGEPTSFWSQAMVPPEGFIHVDIDPAVPGVAFANAPTVAIQSDIKAFVHALLQHENLQVTPAPLLPSPEDLEAGVATESLVRPEILFEAIQKVFVEGSDAVILADSGNSFIWATNALRFTQPRYRISTGVGSMGHATTGVVGAAVARNGKAVSIAGDGAMLMNNEISTAVKYQIPAVWIVLNDARYNMSYQGMAMLGLKGADATFSQADFAMIARGMGAEAIRVSQESDIVSALQQALAATGPIVIDVLIDPDRRAPSKGRNQALASQGVKTTPAKATTTPATEQVSFPLVSFPNA